VTDPTSPTGGRPVGVRFRLPENEVTELSYPVIIIEHSGIFPAPEREHRGYIQLPYAPEGYAPWWSSSAINYDPSLSPYYSYFPVPYNFDYVVTLYSRLSHFHMIPLVEQIAGEDRLPYHMGYINIPQDQTKRTMQLLAGPEFGYEKDQDGKRRYFVTWKVRVFSELVPGVAAIGVDLFRINTIHLDLSVYDSVADLDWLELSETRSIVSAGTPQLGFNVAIPPAIPEEESLFPAQHMRRALPKVPRRNPRRPF
jgi:hypothetical protein